jgi:hypothetical protein
MAPSVIRKDTGKRLKKGICPTVIPPATAREAKSSDNWRSGRSGIVLFAKA